MFFTSRSNDDIQKPKYYFKQVFYKPAFISTNDFNEDIKNFQV